MARASALVIPPYLGEVIVMSKENKPSDADSLSPEELEQVSGGLPRSSASETRTNLASEITNPGTENQDST